MEGGLNKFTSKLRDLSTTHLMDYQGNTNLANYFRLLALSLIFVRLSKTLLVSATRKLSIKRVRISSSKYIIYLKIIKMQLDFLHVSI